jgi:hypothetical protein
MEIPEFAGIPIPPDGDLPTQKELITEALTSVCASDYSLMKVRFLLAVKSCINFHTLTISIADIMFTFGMSLSRSEQMTQNAWERRWTSHEQRYVGNRQFNVDVDDAKRLSVFILQQSKDRIDIPTIIPEFHAVVEKLFPDDPILHALMDQTAYKGMTIPVIIANTISSYPSFGWMHLFANNAVLRAEITTLMKFFQLIKGDIYAGFRIPGIATGVKNLAYLCVKLQAEIGGDEQILKYNGIGGLQNTTPIPLKTYINSLVNEIEPHK